MKPSDEFWLLDWPTNPIYVPTFFVLQRPKEVIPFTEMLTLAYDRVCNNRENRATVKLVKMFGKYFF